MSDRITYRLPGEGSMTRLGPTEYLVDKATGEDTDGEYTLYEVISASGSGVPLHEHVWAEAFWVLEGEYRISYVEDDEEQSLDCKPGTFVHVPGGRLHAFLNIHSDYSRMLSINVPVGLERLLRQVGVPVSGLGAKPDREPLPIDEFRQAFTEGGVRVAKDRMGPGGGPGAWKD